MKRKDDRNIGIFGLLIQSLPELAVFICLLFGSIAGFIGLWLVSVICLVVAPIALWRLGERSAGKQK